MITIRWRPELRFYEERFTFLREFEDRDELRAFRVGDDFVDARLFDSHYQLRLRHDSLSLRLVSPAADVERAWGVVCAALTRVEPQPRDLIANFLHLEPFDVEFDDVVQRGYDRLFHWASGPREIHMHDWAFLADIHAPDVSAYGQVEFGVVKREEVAHRLARGASRTSSEQLAVPPEILAAATFPEVSLFADSTLSARVDNPEGLEDAVRTFWEGARNETGKLVSNLHQVLNADQSQPGGDTQ